MHRCSCGGRDLRSSETSRAGLLPQLSLCHLKCISLLARSHIWFGNCMREPEDGDRSLYSGGQSIGGVSGTLTELNNAVSTSRKKTRRAPLSTSRMRVHEHSSFRVASRLLGSIKAAASVSGFHVCSDVVVPLVSLRTAIPLHFYR